MSSEEAVREAAGRARTASHALATATRATKDAALHAMADALLASASQVLAANAEDVARAEAAGTPVNIVDRLRLDDDRLAAGICLKAGNAVLLRGSSSASGATARSSR